MPMITVRYNYRLRPGSQAVQFLTSEFHNSRWIWNESVNQQRTGRKPTFTKLNALLTQARSQSKWLRSGSSVSQQQTIRVYSQSLNQSFKVKGRGRPKIKKKDRTLPSLQYTTAGFSVKDNVLHLPHKITIPIVLSRPLPSPPTSVRVYQDSIGHWYASFVVQRGEDSTSESTGEIGIDWGISATATTTSSSYDLPYQGHRKRCAAELAKSQRKMSRRRTPKGHPKSKGYLKAKLSTARIHKKAARQAKHSAIQWSKSLVQDHSFVAIEDFKPKFMFRNRRLSRKAADASIGSIKRTLIEIATQQGRTVVKVPPAYTTMTCSNCFARAKQRLELSQRTFHCDQCFHKQDRDRNAANVVLAFAKAAQVGINLASADGIRQWQALNKPNTAT